MKTSRFYLVFLLLLSAASFAPAQMKSDPSGTWGGVMTTDEGPGAMQLALERVNSQWHATMKIRLGGEEISPTVHDLKIEDAQISYTANMGSNQLKVQGKFAGDTLNGTIAVFRGDRQVGNATFGLTFGAPMPTVQSSQAVGQQADPDFSAKVENPAYKKHGPQVLFDEAHNNFHTASGRYKPFADLLTNDGYRIIPNKQNFSAAALKGSRILVISNAIGAARMNDASAGQAAFTEAESDAVREWVRGGGSLLLIADHAPMGSANQILAQRFGVDMSKAFTVDPANSDQESQNPGFIVYTRESGRLVDHPVTRGRNASERVSKIITFTGQSLKGPADSIAFLKLADTARDAMPGQNTNPSTAAGRAQGIAMKFGKGRVIVLGEAGMLTAQVAGPQRLKFGMNRPGIDNKQLALNIMRWLSGKL